MKPPPVATFYGTVTPATRYLRCELPARYLPALVAEGHAAAIGETNVMFPEHRGSAAVVQLAADKMSALITHLMRDQGIRVLVETDDNYTARPPKAIMRRASWGKRIGEKPHTMDGHAYVAKHADGIIVSTPFLADQYRHLNPNVYVCPNTVDPVDWPDLDKPDDGILRIVWAAGMSHERDSSLVVGAMAWASRQKDVEVRVVGFDPGWRFGGSYQALQWLTRLKDYRAHFRMFDIGVAPVRPHPFFNGRSDVKFLEMSMGGVASVLSDGIPYAGVPDDVCMKAKDARGFQDAIRHLVKNRDEVKQLAAAAREYVLRERTTESQVHLWREAVEG